MPYQGLALAFLLGVGIATAAICFFVGEVANRRLESPYENRASVDYDSPPNSWAPRNPVNNDTRRRRNRNRSGRRGEGDVEEKCSICFQPIAIDVNRTKTLTCGHSFHITCIGKWIETAGCSASCPNCRQAI
ncbi:uncharacterized protein [Anabrus simplex]|uniref:uncharacterized protein n=1 Tax=Anabrus simplex TaxID=316456 RepID=UPI0035A37B1D